MRKLCLLLIYFVVLNKAYAQEYTKALHGNAVLQSFSKNPKANISNQKTSAQVSLPFFDDFSYPGPFPSTTFWLDSNVYINNSFAIKPPSHGVATFEGLNKFGNPYSPFDPSLRGKADSLTSRYINLSGLFPKDSIYLSFYIQAKGLGNAPKSNDSISVQFKVANKAWNSVWAKNYNPKLDSVLDTVFTLIHIPIKDSAWCRDSFQFRIVNYANLSGNVNHWHVDYVLLDKNRTYKDKDFSDIAISAGNATLLQGYTQMPWRYYNTLYTIDSSKCVVHNLYENKTQNVAYKFVVNNADASHGDTSVTFVKPVAAQSYVNFNAFSTMVLTPAAGANEDSLDFNFRHIIETGDNFAQNDTLKYTQHFYNYFAYDDGTAEESYGLNASDAQLAIKYFLPQADSVQGAWIHFDQEYGNVSQNLFRLAVWTDLNKAPVATSIYYQPYYTGLQNGFYYYPFDNGKKAYLKDTIYIGWQQRNNVILNLGLDLSKDASQYVQYNVVGKWTKSGIKGSLMFRPVLGKYVVATGTAPMPLTSEKLFSFYPNPANGLLFLKQNATGDKFAYAELMNISGQKLSAITQFPFDISAYAPGVYLLKINTSKGFSEIHKLIIR